MTTTFTAGIPSEDMIGDDPGREAEEGEGPLSVPEPPAPSWGLMIAEGKNHMLLDPWLVGIPGTALFILILSINLLGDGIRDVTAPENRN